MQKLERGPDNSYITVGAGNMLTEAREGIRFFGREYLYQCFRLFIMRVINCVLMDEILKSHTFPLLFLL